MLSSHHNTNSHCPHHNLHYKIMLSLLSNKRKALSSVLCITSPVLLRQMHILPSTEKVGTERLSNLLKFHTGSKQESRDSSPLLTPAQHPFSLAFPFHPWVTRPFWAWPSRYLKGSSGKRIILLWAGCPQTTNPPGKLTVSTPVPWNPHAWEMKP